MVIRPDPRLGALTVVRRRQWGPWWLWSIVVILAVSAAYAGYVARQSQERLAGIETERESLASDKDVLAAGATTLKRQLEDANQRADKSRADADALSALIAKQQARVTTLQSELESARDSAETSKKEAERLRAQAESATAAFEQVRNLQERITALKSEADAAHAEAEESRKAVARLTAEAADAARTKSALESQVERLSSELGQLQRKQDATAAVPAQP